MIHSTNTNTQTCEACMCSLDVGPGRRKQKLEDHSGRQGHLKRMKARHENQNAVGHTDGDIPIPLLVYFGLDEEHRDTRARIALLVPLPPRHAVYFPIFPPWVGKVWEIGRTEAWGGDGSPSPRPPLLTSLSRISWDSPPPLCRRI